MLYVINGLLLHNSYRYKLCSGDSWQYVHDCSQMLVVSCMILKICIKVQCLQWHSLTVNGWKERKEKAKEFDVFKCMHSQIQESETFWLPWNMPGPFSGPGPAELLYRAQQFGDWPAEVKYLSNSSLDRFERIQRRPCSLLLSVGATSVFRIRIWQDHESSRYIQCTFSLYSQWI